MIQRRQIVSTLALGCIFAAPIAATAQFKSLLRRVPEQANAILLLDLDAIKISKIGIKEKWAARHKENHLAGATNIPPGVQDLVVAAHIDPATLNEEWKIAMPG
jgi:hypothetical protein